MASFAEAYTRWRQAQIPDGSAVDSLDEIHADLVLADTWVAESVVPFAENGRYSAAQVDVLGELGDLRARAAEAHSAEPRYARPAVEYRAYIDLLESVYRAFLAEAPVQ